MVQWIFPSFRFAFVMKLLCMCVYSLMGRQYNLDISMDGSYDGGGVCNQCLLVETRLKYPFSGQRKSSSGFN